MLKIFYFGESASIDSNAIKKGEGNAERCPHVFPHMARRNHRGLIQYIQLFMLDDERKISINIRTKTRASDSHTHKKVSAHLHAHKHDAVSKDQTIPTASKEVTVLHGANESALGFESTKADIPITCELPKDSAVQVGLEMSDLSVAYFCMEMGITESIPTYAGGLGILAGDTLQSCADLKLNVVGVTLLYRDGYFRQSLDDSGWQVEEKEIWDPSKYMTLLHDEVAVVIEGRSVRVRAWLYKMNGISGNTNPVIFLDTDVDGNSDEDRAITQRLYVGDRRHRLIQEAILGIGGTRMLAKIGATNIHKYHMNEGHSALLALELYREYSSCALPIEEVRRRTVFTTHTPVEARHDKFDESLVLSVLGNDVIPEAIRHLVFEDGMLNMTRFGFQLSEHINGVAKKHGEVTRELFPRYRIESITNGVHAVKWVAAPLARVYDKYLPDWRNDPYSLRYALSLPAEELWLAHQESKNQLFAYVAKTTGGQFDPDILTIGFARRATAYKRGNMLFRDVGRLKYIAEKSKGIQIIYSGKAHPEDHDGKLLLQEITRNMHIDSAKITCVYLPNYDIAIAKLMVAGVDLWLNTPARPQEASGTSGMKAALNGVPHFSTLDGWWLEGHIENVTGWSIGAHPEENGSWDADAEDSDDLYKKLEYVIIPRFEGDRHTWIKMMRGAIAINGSFFNTQRMVEQYVLTAYFK